MQIHLYKFYHLQVEKQYLAYTFFIEILTIFSPNKPHGVPHSLYYLDGGRLTTIHNSGW